jgi:hypothetical protein
VKSFVKNAAKMFSPSKISLTSHETKAKVDPEKVSSGLKRSAPKPGPGVEQPTKSPKTDASQLAGKTESSQIITMFESNQIKPAAPASLPTSISGKGPATLLSKSSNESSVSAVSISNAKEKQKQLAEARKQRLAELRGKVSERTLVGRLH